MEMIDILKATVQKGASDLHLVIGLPPMVRQDGDLKPLTEFPVLTADESRRLVYTLLSDEQRARFEKEWELDFSVAVDQVSRFRANVLLQKKWGGGCATRHLRQNSNARRTRAAARHYRFS